VEEQLSRGIQKTDQGTFLSLDPNMINQVIQAAGEEAKKAVNDGYQPLIICSPMVRRHLRRILERFLPEVVILSHSELVSPVEIKALGRIEITNAG
jgi:flagellar biosynthesis protein FlhA